MSSYISTGSQSGEKVSMSPILILNDTNNTMKKKWFRTHGHVSGKAFVCSLIRLEVRIMNYSLVYPYCGVCARLTVILDWKLTMVPNVRCLWISLHYCISSFLIYRREWLMRDLPFDTIQLNFLCFCNGSVIMSRTSHECFKLWTK